VKSVHAFGEDNVLALQFVAFLAVILVVSIGLIVYRQNKLATKTEFDSFYSREFAFLVNNWILLACAFFVLFATMFPTISEALDGSRVSVGPEFFNKWMTPLGLTLLVLAGAAPLLAWRKTTTERLWNQFMFPTAFSAATIAILAVALPKTRHLSPLLADGLRLPVSLINFGIVAFVIGSIAQEFWRGAAVRRKQTGSDPMTSIIGLVLAKRRKYGGYIVHLGVAVLFIGFAGKAYEHMIDRTIDKPQIGAKVGSAQSWTFGDYSFTYENLFHTSDDHKDAFTAQVGIWEGGEKIATVYPAKWDYHKADGNLISQVAITPRYLPTQWSETAGGGDVYLVLTGYDLDSGQANFRVYLNPLISWVWIGFLILAFGTLVCLIPQSLADFMQWKPKTRIGRAADVGIVLAIIAGITFGISTQAHAAGGGGGEHVPAGMGMGNAGGGYAAQNRPQNATEQKAMKELLCPCGCARESILECDCATAARLRAKVQAIMADENVSTDAGKSRAYDDVLAAFRSEYGDDVLATPRSKASWLAPVVVVVAGLGVLGVLGRRWVKGAQRESATKDAAAKAAAASAGDEYADKLDDELAETD
jgi:cytochrome c-type biogenesis protein CcmF